MMPPERNSTQGGDTTLPTLQEASVTSGSKSIVYFPEVKPTLWRFLPNNVNNEMCDQGYKSYGDLLLKNPI